ncbi:ABC transporter ATP-binding protein [Agromyces sp. ISL-38]|uniref:ATP-binding cassette domain-containing protein n=1 Tax=Agromyces sp. ISL-38 TaxID=2819107 RepID=UPI001BEA84BE|nr:dipeptide/oligopeptide/nickel ABC transporter ATP-binding protein [Agromyces sp. ISL-38]MBT2498519.1 ABC transporter ATP-binding protein [Agromyces sp. ISL-38]MBT2518872.1 ABC transporter ATP-binding protein [Streptomyces sp. ISL-90]
MPRAAHRYPIVLSDLSIEYPAHGASPAHVALHGLSLTIAPGEVLGMLGSAGSGKSTLAKVLSGVAFEPRTGDVRPVITGGEATVLGHQLRGLSKRKLPEYLFHVGYLPQDAASTLPADRTVAEIVAEPILERDRRYNRHALTTRVATMIDGVRLPLGMLDRFPYELSGGQRQRVALARALVLGPSVLIADEPTAGIDLTVRDAVAQLIRDLREQHTFSAIIISHDLPVLRRTADRIAVLDKGELAAIGTIDEVFHDPRHPYVMALAGALDAGHAVIDELDSGPLA